ncbi:1-acyl-sn-glycerol-3-phosphate acyltransferase [Entomomonas asaccharolytica]|uniref:1-acyl-sn-glycerol-3-phosphate acyltransferase n=1 Tax=Entomomonas asaccharolytica TaxID=2785331 RepID=A0A974NH96_9GAMM|nr:1-acyl-sn-glycerol-3-phosphate acyltransferase [Entomomonas asaccharolytica]QQP86342.1 1-acyl-sn-glycerol-3-phosphate acyltransferase [Entomomonas asaccharolytica]
MGQFNTIRPYHDDEVPAVIERLSKDNEFINTVLKFRFPHLSSSFGWLLRPFIARKLKNYLSKIHSVRDLQLKIADYVEHSISSSIERFTYSGGENVDTQCKYLFMANHRDIVMDPTLTNYALHLIGMGTPRIAIGDNLLQKQYVADLMRLNKSFVVQRSVTGRKEKLAAYQQLSAYINHSILHDHESIWIAQAEGRAKDGNDETDSALLKMLHISRKEENFVEVIASLNLLPISISYEYDPCDLMKARELYIKATEGKYTKAVGEDDRSIALGITGYKGDVHVHFGKRINNGFEDAKELADLIDQQILGNYHLFPVHYLAYAMWDKADQTINIPAIESLFPVEKIEKAKHEWQKRLDACPEEHKPYLIMQYAYPVYNKYRLNNGKLA